MAELTDKEISFLELVAIHIPEGKEITDEVIKEATREAIKTQEKTLLKFYSMSPNEKEVFIKGIAEVVYEKMRSESK